MDIGPVVASDIPCFPVDWGWLRPHVSSPRGLATHAKSTGPSFAIVMSTLYICPSQAGTIFTCAPLRFPGGSWLGGENFTVRGWRITTYHSPPAQADSPSERSPSELSCQRSALRPWCSRAADKYSNFTPRLYTVAPIRYLYIFPVLYSRVAPFSLLIITVFIFHLMRLTIFPPEITYFLEQAGFITIIQSKY